MMAEVSTCASAPAAAQAALARGQRAFRGGSSKSFGLGAERGAGQWLQEFGMAPRVRNGSKSPEALGSLGWSAARLRARAGRKGPGAAGGGGRGAHPRRLELRRRGREVALGPGRLRTKPLPARVSVKPLTRPPSAAAIAPRRALAGAIDVSN
jgi:hypothetical protein